MPPVKRNASLGVLVLWVAVCAVGCLNLKILVDHRDHIAIIWEDGLKWYHGDIWRVDAERSPWSS